MPITNPNKPITKQDLSDFYQGILPYLGGSADAGFAPVGMLIMVMGVTAPANYLACDGTVYNISDYPELATYFYQQFGSKNKFGGNGTTTFAVPDLRGEFLRGAGTNSHANQGNGASVGTHQDATVIPHFQSNVKDSATNNLYFGTDANTRGIVNADKNIMSATGGYADYSFNRDSQINRTDSQAVQHTTRPTNTSVLFCIATKNIYLNPANDYSTEEKVVGTWIDGSTLYEKTVVLDSGLSFADKNVTKSFNILDATNLSVKKMEGTYYFTYANTNRKYVFNLGQAYMEDNDTSVYLNSWLQDAEESDKYVKVSIKQSMSALGSVHTLHNIIVTIQYTKTTD